MSVMPTHLQLHKSSKTLDVNWSNGELSTISTSDLRRYCACSSCRARGVVGSELINESSDVTDIKSLGASAVQIVFADGHDRGIYPWSYLKAIAEGRAMEVLES